VQVVPLTAPVPHGTTRRRPLDVVIVVAIVVLVVLWALDWVQYVLQADRSLVAVDFTLYRDAAHRWLQEGIFYRPEQIAGPYDVTPGDVLYPPTSLLLFVPFTALPALLYWILPLVVTTLIVVRHRPSVLGWLIIAICLWFPATNVKLLAGNPVIWVMSAVALGTVWPVAAPFALVKLTLAPFAAVRINERMWWVGLAILLAASALFLSMWGDYLTVLMNAREPRGFLYSIQEFPMLSIPVVAWLARTNRRQRMSAGLGSPGGSPPVAIPSP
jgi:hypothetical protein